MRIDILRHPKELTYLNFCRCIGVIVWGLLLFTPFILVPILFLPLFVLFLWVSEKFFQASIYGNSVHVNSRQYSEIYELTESLSQKMQLKRTPEVFVVNSNGVINAFAVKYFSAKYVVLNSNIIDLLWCEKSQGKLRTVIAHELAHHAAGHINFWNNLLIKPALFIPFLGAAYKRSRELTADRIAAALVGKTEATAAMITIASGSSRLIPQTSENAFLRQESSVPVFFGFLQEILSSHPRWTKRILALKTFFPSKEDCDSTDQSTKPIQTAEIIY